VICISIILLDNLLQCLICIFLINLSSTYDYIVVFICKSLVMLMSYFWIKIKLKVILYPIIQKPYCRHFGFMARFLHALWPTPFTSVHFKRWQVRVTLWLNALNVLLVFEDKPEAQLTVVLEKAYGEANTIFVGTMIGVHVDHL
jgi:hypothetical protein